MCSSISRSLCRSFYLSRLIIRDDLGFLNNRLYHLLWSLNYSRRLIHVLSRSLSRSYFLGHWDFWRCLDDWFTDGGRLDNGLDNGL